MAFEPPRPQWRGRSYWRRPSYDHLMIATFHLLIDNSFLKVHLILATSHITMKVHSNLDVVFIGVVWQPTDVDLPDRVHHSRTHIDFLFFGSFFETKTLWKWSDWRWIRFVKCHCISLGNNRTLWPHFNDKLGVLFEIFGRQGQYICEQGWRQFWWPGLIRVEMFVDWLEMSHGITWYFLQYGKYDCWSKNWSKNW